MCGVFGWNFSGAVPRQHGILAMALAVQNESRGNHGWGYCGFEDDGSLVMNKGVGSFTANAPFELLSEMPMVQCHTRYSTTGSKTQENSHPFQIGNIIGVHNGIIRNCYALENKYPERKPFQVDSMHIFAHLNEEKDMNELDGYAAVTYMDIREAWPTRKMRLFVFNTDDLHVARINGVGTVWSSNKSHLIRALRASGYSAATKDNSTTPREFILFEELKPGWDYYLTPANLFKPTRKLYKEAQRLTTSTDSHGHHENWSRGDYTVGSKRKGGRSGTEALGYRGGSQASQTGTPLHGVTGDNYDAEKDMVLCCQECGVLYEPEQEELRVCWVCGNELDEQSMQWLVTHEPDTQAYDLEGVSPIINGWVSVTALGLKETDKTKAYEYALTLMLDALESHKKGATEASAACIKQIQDDILTKPEELQTKKAHRRKVRRLRRQISRFRNASALNQDAAKANDASAVSA